MEGYPESPRRLPPAVEAGREEVSGFALPPGRPVQLPGSGRLYVREASGPPGSPTVLLLHGLALSAALNWVTAFEALSRSFRVVAPDLAGHGRSDRRRPPVSLEDLADDLAALPGVLDPSSPVVVGYSLGGLIAQLLWRRHPAQVSGLVLCATASSLGRSSLERSTLEMSLRALTWAPFPFTLTTQALGELLVGELADRELRRFARREIARADPSTVLAAARAACRFDSSGWIRTVDVPTAVVVTGGDDIVARPLQERLAAALPGATVHRVRCGHGGCLEAPGRFVPALVEAVRSVALRAHGYSSGEPAAGLGSSLVR